MTADDELHMLALAEAAVAHQYGPLKAFISAEFQRYQETLAAKIRETGAAAVKDFTDQLAMLEARISALESAREYRH